MKTPFDMQFHDEVHRVLSRPHRLLTDRATAARKALVACLDEGRRDVQRERDLLIEYHTMLAAADYLVGYDQQPKFFFVKASETNANTVALEEGDGDEDIQA